MGRVILLVRKLILYSRSDIDLEQVNGDIRVIKHYDDIAVIYNCSKEEIVSIVRRKHAKNHGCNLSDALAGINTGEWKMFKPKGK